MKFEKCKALEVLGFNGLFYVTMIIIMTITIGITIVIEKQIIAVLLLSVVLLLLYFISAFQFYTFLITALNASCGIVY